MKMMIMRTTVIQKIQFKMGIDFFISSCCVLSNQVVRRDTHLRFSYTDDFSYALEVFRQA